MRGDSRPPPPIITGQAWNVEHAGRGDARQHQNSIVMYVGLTRLTAGPGDARRLRVSDTPSAARGWHGNPDRGVCHGACDDPLQN